MKLTEYQIKELASENGIEYACLKAVVDVESRGSGFLNGLPIILFEPHIFYKMLGEKGYLTLRLKMQAINPKILYQKWRTFPYGKTSEQHDRLNQAVNLVYQALPNLNTDNPNDKKIIDDVRECALMACSWGLAQIMGFHWQSLGYDSVQDFVNAMYDSEKSQLDAMLRFCKKNGLLTHLKNKDWARFARGYNGAGYKANAYDVKLARAYQKYR